MGWDPGNYAGYPLFYHYFPLTFIFMAVLGFIIPIEVAFKIGTVLGVFLLPVCVFFAFRFLKYKFPIPIIAACFTLPFLFMESNSMWGGNIPSMLAGESSYAFSFAIMLLFFGSLYDGIRNNDKIIFNSLLLFLIGFSHGFTFVFTGVIGAFFLLTRKDFFKNFIYLVKTYGLAGLLLAFWFIPFLANIPYVTSYVTRWHIESIWKVIPIVLMPFWGLSVVAIALNLFDRRTYYFIYIVVASCILYWLAPSIGMLDIRFVPFIQLYLCVFGATAIASFIAKIKNKEFLPFIVFLAVILFVLPNVTYIKGWIKWNYEGLENKASYPLAQKIHNYLRANGNGRVVYEHSPAHNTFGSERIFENLPYYAGRETLEGLYMQSSISSPFIFYIQSEVSKVHSGPFPQYKYTQLNLKPALAHLKMFNVTQYIVRSPKAKAAAAQIPELKKEVRFDDYEIYRLTANDGHYVAALKYQPVLFETPNWKRDFFEWFRRQDLLDTHLIYAKEPGSELTLKAADLLELPKVETRVANVKITEKMGNDWLEFTTNQIGKPHLIKISYHPNWQVEGANRIYLVSPSFMLVYPNQEHVRLYFGKTVYNRAGEMLSFIGLTIVLFSILRRTTSNHS